jgi:hypothetical protein
MSQSVRQIFADLIEKRLLAQSQLRGCSELEIMQIERMHGRKLPNQYREFLFIAGRQAGYLFQGTDIFYPTLLTLKSYATQLLEESSKSALLPDKSFVYLVHCGYIFHYFCSDDDDPPIYGFCEGDSSIAESTLTFTEFLSQEIEQHLAMFGSLSKEMR